MATDISLTINGEPRRAAPGSIADLVRSLELDPAKVAVERNGEIVPRSTLAAVEIAQGDVLEIVHFVGGLGLWLLKSATRVRIPSGLRKQ